MVFLVRMKEAAAFPVVVLAAILALALAGCSGGQGASSSSSSASSESGVEVVEETMTVFGDEGANGNVVIENGLGSPVTAVIVAPSNASDAAVDLPVQNGPWKAGDSAKIYFAHDGAVSAYDVTLEAGGQAYVLHGIELPKIETATLMLDGAFAYLSYESNGESVSTLAHEQELAAAAEAAAAEAAAAEAAAAEAAAAEAAAAEAAANEVYYEEQAPAQSSDSCVDGGVVLR